jgi:hypothetical protein
MRTQRLRYGIIALLVFLVELLIAMKVPHASFVRGSLGDILVVVLIYALALSIRDFDRPRLAATVFLFACFIELCQYFRLAQTLGLRPNGVLWIVIGSTATWEDIGCYLVGAAVALIGDLVALRFRS